MNLTNKQAAVIEALSDYTDLETIKLFLFKGMSKVTFMFDSEGVMEEHVGYYRNGKQIIICRESYPELILAGELGRLIMANSTHSPDDWEALRNFVLELWPYSFEGVMEFDTYYKVSPMWNAFQKALDDAEQSNRSVAGLE